MTIPTTPVHVGAEPGGVYINARDAEVWHRALKLALDPYKAPEIRSAADKSLAALQRLLLAGAEGRDAIPLGDLADAENAEIIARSRR